MVEGGSDAEAVAAAEVPGAAVFNRVVDEDPATGGAKRSGIEAKGGVVVLPR